MTNFIFLPNGKILNINGGKMGEIGILCRAVRHLLTLFEEPLGMATIVGRLGILMAMFRY